MAAADAAARVYACGEAESWYRIAVDLARRLADISASATALERLGSVVASTGRHDEALTALEEAAQTYRRLGDLASEAIVTAHIGMVHRERGTPMEGVRRLRMLLPKLEAAGPSDALAPSHLSLGHVLFVASDYSHYSPYSHYSDYKDRAAAAERAAELAERLQDDSMLAEAKTRLGACLTNLSRNDEAVAVLDEALALAERGDDLCLLAMATTNRGSHMPPAKCGMRSLRSTGKLSHGAGIDVAFVEPEHRCSM